MELSQPPFLPHLLFENPHWQIVFLLVATVLLLFAAVHTKRRTVDHTRIPQAMTIAAIILLMAAVANFLLARNVQTEREKLIMQTELLVTHVAEGHLDEIRNMLASRSVVFFQDGLPWLRLNQIFDKIKSYPIHDYHFRDDVKSEVRGSQWGRTLLKIQTTFNPSSTPVNSKWLLTWTTDANKNWLITKIQWLRLNGKKVTRDIVR